MVTLLDGKKASSALADKLRERAAALRERPTLAIIQVGAREESSAYFERKKAFGESIGAGVQHIQLPESVSEGDIIKRIETLNADKTISGIIVQLPLPANLDRKRIQNAVTPEKDVDGLGVHSVFTPATARGILELLEHHRIPIAGKRVAVLGRSKLVGAPTAEALHRAGAEVTVCHSQTPNTKEITRGSDVIVVAIGKPRLIDASYFRDDKTQVVVDVGITTVGGVKLQEEVGLHRPRGSVGRTPREAKLRGVLGDVDFDAVKDMVAAISPVPGGVGPMTVAALFENLVEACYDTNQRMGTRPKRTVSVRAG